MEGIKVEVISKEIIKPSSPTPNHLSHYQFSFLDQINPPVYTSLVLFFEFNGERQPTINEISQHLKKSLAYVLTLYYPLAGRARLENHFVNCNDEGVPYLEAQVKNCQLSEVLNNPIPEELNKLVPFELDDVAGEFLLGVQLNMFECGGFAIGLCTSHKIADGLSMLMFTKTWAAIARGGHDHDDNQAKIERPEFVSASLFPPKEITGYDAHVGITRNKVTKRFVFDASTIEELRKKYTGLESNKIRPSRIETLSAFIWRRIVEAAKGGDHIDVENKLHMLIHAVNLRPQMDPPLPRSSFGNICLISMTGPFTSSNTSLDNDPCYGMVRHIREAMSKIDNEYVKRLREGDEHLSSFKKLADSFTREHLVTYNFTSLCRYPLYDNDFGWGRPTWVGLPALTFKNLIVFLDTKEAGGGGSGIEAYVSLEKQVMAKFETDVFLQPRLGTSRVSSPTSTLTRQQARFSQVTKYHTQSRPSLCCERPIQTKPMKILWSGSVSLRLLLKVLKK
ncbi:unnamed protein product [Malus baccata var. baccata]|uniref:Vinorine synthase-like n=1 Tax=Malus baccata TaxID=106549 RepID=A0A540LU50_MALBA|nr:hypothetical protein C1H46_024557 [Malus baccata]